MTIIVLGVILLIAGAPSYGYDRQMNNSIKMLDSEKRKSDGLGKGLLIAAVAMGPSSSRW